MVADLVRIFVVRYSLSLSPHHDDTLSDDSSSSAELNMTVVNNCSDTSMDFDWTTRRAEPKDQFDWTSWQRGGDLSKPSTSRHGNGTDPVPSTDDGDGTSMTPPGRSPGKRRASASDLEAPEVRKKSPRKSLPAGNGTNEGAGNGVTHAVTAVAEEPALSPPLSSPSIIPVTSPSSGASADTSPASTPQRCTRSMTPSGRSPGKRRASTSDSEASELRKKSPRKSLPAAEANNINNGDVAVSAAVIDAEAEAPPPPASPPPVLPASIRIDARIRPADFPDSLRVWFTRDQILNSLEMQEIFKCRGLQMQPHLTHLMYCHKRGNYGAPVNHADRVDFLYTLAKVNRPIFMARFRPSEWIDGVYVDHGVNCR